MKILLKSATFFFLLSQTANADYFVNGETDNEFILNSTHKSIDIVSGGNIVPGANAVPKIYADGGNDFAVAVAANEGEGIISDDIAIVVNNGALDLDVSSGEVSGKSSFGTVLLINPTAAGSSINLSSGTTLSNNGNAGFLLLSSGEGSSVVNFLNSTHTNSSLDITNSGTISASTAANSNGISFEDLEGGSILNLQNNSDGVIEASNGHAIDVNGNNLALITNSGRIKGKIDLGEHDSSTITNNGTIDGDIDFGASNQTLKMNAGSTVIGAINGSGKIEVAENAIVGSAGNIGETTALNSVILKSGAQFHLERENNSLRANSVILEDQALLGIGSQSVNSVIEGKNSGNGNVAFYRNNTLAANVGTSSNKVNAITLVGSNTVNAGSNELNAGVIHIFRDSQLNSSGITRANLIFYDEGSTLNLNNNADFNGSIRGFRNGEGTLNIRGNVNLKSDIGTTNNLAEINIAEGSVARISNNSSALTNSIRANNINVSGSIELIKPTIITGNLSLNSANAIFDSGANSHIVNGNFTTSGGSTISAALRLSALDKISVNGNANIAQDTQLLLHHASVDGEKTFALIEGGAGSNINKIKDSDISVNGSNSNRFNNYRFVTERVGDNLMLNIWKVKQDFATGNEKLYNTIIDDNSASGERLAIKNYLDSSLNNNAQKQNVLASTTPQTDNSTNRISFDTVNNSSNLITQRLNNLRLNQGINSGDDIMSSSVWVEAFGSKTKQDQTANIGGYSAKSGGLAFGADKEVNDGLTLGIAAIYASSSIDGGAKKTNINSYHLNFYSAHTFEKFYVNNVIGFGFNNYDSSRSIAVPAVTARADYSGQTYVLRSEIGTNQKLKNDFILTPLLMITAAKNEVDSYDENGAGTLNLHVKNNSTNFLEGRAGIALSKHLNFSKNILTPTISASYGYDFIGDKQRTTANFIGQTTSFGNSATKIAQGSLRLGAGLKLYNVNNYTLSAEYNFEHRNEYSSHTGFLRGKYHF